MSNVMSQMQQLSITPERINQHSTIDSVHTTIIQPQQVDSKTKQKVLLWLRDTGLVKKAIDSEVFPRYCRNGVLYADFLNKLAGKTQPVKGIVRNPVNMAQINSNFDKVMGYLKEFPRFSSRYLWSQQKIIDGDSDVIWGFFDDIWYWKHGKISPYDPAASIEQSLSTR